MLILKQKGSKLELSQKMQGNIFGGACGQGCHDSCPIDNQSLMNSYYYGHQDSIKGLYPLPQ